VFSFPKGPTRKPGRRTCKSTGNWKRRDSRKDCPKSDPNCVDSCWIFRSEKCEWGSCKYCAAGVPGRPFIVDGKSRTTISIEIDNELDSTPWTPSEVRNASTNDSVGKEIGRRWLEQAEGEHASVASFARHTLQLMSIAAPSKILVSSQKAAVDEVNHSKICYGLASSILGYNYEAGPLDIEHSLEKLDLKEVVNSLIKEGCIEETISSVEARLGSYTSKEPVFQTALTQIASEETNHAQLAWDTINWIKKRFPEISGFVEEAFRYHVENNLPVVVENGEFFKESTVCQEFNVDEVLKNYGIVVDGDKEKIRRATMTSIVEPVYLGKLKDVSLISKQIKDLRVDNI